MDSGTNEVMNAIYQNASMGKASINTILKRVQDKRLRDELQTQLDYYVKSHREIEDSFLQTGVEPKDINAFSKAMAEAGITFKTLVDAEESKIAELMIQGTNMGIIEIEKSLNAAGDIPSSVKNEGESVIKHEQKYIEALKNYL